MELKFAALLARQLMDEHGLQDWQFKWDNAIHRFGRCHWIKKTISLSKILSSLCEDHEIRDTILHEIAHALVDYWNGHDEVWRQKALEIGCSGNEASCVVVPYKYEATCKKGHKYYSHRRHFNTSCGYCNKEFDPENILVFHETIKN